jgi:hypothetical protein
MKRNKVVFLTMLLAILLTGSMTSNLFAAYEGGYCGNTPDAPKVVYSFLKNFKYEQFYWACASLFTTRNNNYVDRMDFAYYCGHGSPWSIGYYSNCGSSGTSSYINLATAGLYSNKGYGNINLEFIVFHSCKVIPSPLETKKWWQNWVSEPDDIFDGLHMALGFRTNALKATAPGIAEYYGKRMAAKGYVLWEWFNAINAKGRRTQIYDCGIAVIYPTAQYDRYQSTMSVDPPQNHTRLRVWYQK